MNFQGASLITEKQISTTVSALCIKANTVLRADVKQALCKACASEKNKNAKFILGALIENYKIAEKECTPICQDTGITVVFAEVGYKAKIKGDIGKAINAGVEAGYKEGFLRKSVVSDPLERKNTGTNTPAVIYYDLVPGNKLKITILPKGFGSENKSKLYMLNPTASLEEIKKVIITAIKEAGPDACPPYMIGVGIGGDASKAAFLAKKALTYKIGFWGKDALYKTLAKDLYKRGNRLNIGPLGAKGKTTLLGVNILAFPTHIAGLPVAVNISCHVLRSASKTL
ncbi:MAG: fumarate hydratase [Candidatus Firestonebacteria bacterium RIFOXYC2_FULL_39_67]|nr:MAG: fumarate hydratase [Candidatus Firestonebacteria bacterium RIFOXYD2_FULL_39_29]OGF53722.1 MAG: fumarate hydratase [Candidatus Firestonebacteria bacterium RIFOXYC2_FULL_39_67]